MGSISVAVHILNSERKIGMDWTFIKIHNHASLSYEQLISKIYQESSHRQITKTLNKLEEAQKLILLK